MPLNGKYLDSNGLSYLWSKLKSKFATAAQGTKADTALQQSDVSSTYSASGTAPVNGTAVNAAIETLDVGSVGGSGKYISAISETNGKISATPTTFDTVLSSSSTNGNAPTSKTVYDDQERQEAEIGAVANAGAKNLFKNDKNAGATVVKQGATWVFDATSVEAKVSGSVSDTWSDVYLLNSSLDLSDKEYTIVIESDSPNLFMYIPGNTLSGGNIPSNGQYYPGVYKYKGIMTTSTRFTAKTASYSNNTIQCMICPASITDSTFVPYALPNPVITPALIEQVDAGSKNIADMSKSSFTTLTKDSVTVTLSGDTITASGTGGTATNNFFNIFYVSNALLVPSGTWVISLVGTGINNFRVEEYDNVHSDVVKGDFGQPLTVTVPDNATQSYIRITSKPSTNCAGTFKLMICTAADWAVSQKFVPYCPSLPEVYEEVQEIKNVGLVSATVPSATANVLEYTGLSITIPKSSIALVGACDTYNNSKPVGLVLSLNSDPSATTATPTSYLLYTIEGASTGQNKVDFVTTIHNTSSSNSMTVYLHAKRATVNSTGNKIILWYHIIS